MWRTGNDNWQGEGFGNGAKLDFTLGQDGYSLSVSSDFGLESN